MSINITTKIGNKIYNESYDNVKNITHEIGCIDFSKIEGIPNELNSEFENNGCLWSENCKKCIGCCSCIDCTNSKFLDTCKNCHNCTSLFNAKNINNYLVSQANLYLENYNKLDKNIIKIIDEKLKFNLKNNLYFSKYFYKKDDEDYEDYEYDHLYLTNLDIVKLLINQYNFPTNAFPKEIIDEINEN